MINLKKKNKVENWEDKLIQIKKVLEMTDKPLSYNEIEQKTGLIYEEVFRIISWYFSKITKETTSSGFAHPEFYLFGDNIKEIRNNWGYKIVKSRLELGSKTMDITGGKLR